MAKPYKFGQANSGWGGTNKTFQELAQERADKVRFLGVKLVWWRIQALIPLKMW